MSEYEQNLLSDLSARGDSDAIWNLLIGHRERLKRMVAIHLDRRLAARLDPSDVVQEGLTEAIRRLPQYLKERPVAVYPWLRKLIWEKLLQMRQHHLDMQKRDPRRERSLDLSAESSDQLANQLVGREMNPSEQLRRDEMRDRVHRLLLELATTDRELLSMRYLEEMTVEEITAAIGISEEAYMKRHWRAMQRIRQRIGKP